MSTSRDDVARILGQQTGSPSTPISQPQNNQDDIKKDLEAHAEAPAQPPDNPWPTRLATWKNFSEKMHTRGQQIEARYEDERDNAVAAMGTQMGASVKRVNTFYSNVTVIKESLYNSLPEPDVNRMHQGDFDNEPARVAATIIERGLTYEIRCAKYFDTAIKASILDRLVPGMGTLWVNWTPQKTRGTRTIPEAISVDIVYWRDFIYEPQRAWEQVTWAGRMLHMEKDAAKKRWGEWALSCAKNSTSDFLMSDREINEGKVNVIEMWDKTNLVMHFMRPDGFILQTVPDPYELIEFWPCPKPMMASPSTRKFLPLPDYYMAQDQYLELDILYMRINLIIEAVRVAGVYDSSVPEIGRMLSGTENKLIPVDNWAMFADKGGVKGVIDWFPVEQITGVLQQLTSTYTFIKQELYEVTGMADIVRGSTNQYETAAAQQIKAQFASVRLNAFQRDVAFFVRDSVRIMAEMMCQLYSDTKLSQVCGQLPQGDQQYIQQALQIIRNDFMMMYNVDISSDSLTQADWSLQQGQRQSYVQVLAQFFQTALPVAQQMPMLAPLLVQMIKFASVGFKGASDLESTLDSVLGQLQQQAQAAAQGGGQGQGQQDPAQQKLAAQIQLLQMEAQFKQQNQEQTMAHRQQMHDSELSFKQQSQQIDLQAKQASSGIKLSTDAISGAQDVHHQVTMNSIKQGGAAAAASEV
jgi:hypothetical protein